MPDALPNESELVTSLGIQYINIPVVWTTPTKDELDRFMAELDGNQDNKILEHRQANFRATAFVALYRIFTHGWDPKDAVEDMHKVREAEEYPM